MSSLYKRAKQKFNNRKQLGVLRDQASRMERVNKTAKFPGRIRRAAGSALAGFLVKHLPDDAACRPALIEEQKRQVLAETVESFKRCFRDSNDAMMCINEIERALDPSKIKITAVYDPISVEETASPPPTGVVASSSIPPAPPIVLSQIVNPKTNMVEGVVMIPAAPPLGGGGGGDSNIPAAPPIIRAVDTPYTPARGTEITKGTPAAMQDVLAGIRSHAGKPLKSSVARTQASKDTDLTETINFVATRAGPNRKAAIVPVSDDRQSMFDQIKAGAAGGLKKVTRRETPTTTTTPESEHLAALRGGAAGLKHVTKTRVGQAPPRPAIAENSMMGELQAKMAARNAALRMEEADPDDDDDTDDDDVGGDEWAYSQHQRHQSPPSPPPSEYYSNASVTELGDEHILDDAAMYRRRRSRSSRQRRSQQRNNIDSRERLRRRAARFEYPTPPPLVVRRNSNSNGNGNDDYDSSNSRRFNARRSRFEYPAPERGRRLGSRRGGTASADFSDDSTDDSSRREEFNARRAMFGGPQ